MRKVTVHGLAFYALADGTLFPVLTGAKGHAPPPAAPSLEERRLLNLQGDAAQSQLQLAKAQQRENQALMPFLMDQYGITRTETQNASTNPHYAALTAEREQLANRSDPQALTRMKVIDARLAQMNKKAGTTIEYKNTDPNAAKEKEIHGMQLDRSLKALKGELPVTATLAKELELGKRTLGERLSRQLGPGYETTSAGIQANAEYDRMATSLREAEQKDQLTTAEALSINRQQARSANTQDAYNLSEAPRAGVSRLYASAGGGAGDALNYYTTLRNASMQAQQNRSNETGGYVSGGIGLVGTGAMALAI